MRVIQCVRSFAKAFGLGIYAIMLPSSGFSNSFNNTDLSLSTHLHIGLKLCILSGNSEFLI